MATKASTDVNLYGYSRHPEDIRLPGALAAFIDKMLSQKFLIILPSERGTRRAWARQFSTGISAPLTTAEFQAPQISPAANDAIQQFNAGTAQSITLSMLSLISTEPASGFHFDLDLNASEGVIQALADDGDFMRHGQGDDERYEHWLSTLQHIYTLWHPLLAFAVDDRQDFMTTPEQARHYVPAFLYDFNFFGPEIVEKLNRDRFVDLQAWRNIALDDGGVLLVPTPYYALGTQYDREAIAAQLGMTDQVFHVEPELLAELSKKANQLRAQKMADDTP